MQRQKVNIPVLIVTQFDRFGEERDRGFMTLAQLQEELEQKYPNYIGTIQYKGNIDDWRPAIRDVLRGRLPERGPGDDKRSDS